MANYYYYYHNHDNSSILFYELLLLDWLSSSHNQKSRLRHRAEGEEISRLDSKVKGFAHRLWPGTHSAGARYWAVNVSCLPNTNIANNIHHSEEEEEEKEDSA